MIFYIIVFLFIFALIIVMLANTAWGQHHFKWQSSFWTFIVIGLILGLCLISIGYIIGRGIAHYY